jgi:hypothetical protein
MRRSLGRLADTHEQKALGGKTSRRVQKEGFVGPCLEFSGSKHSGGGGSNSSIAQEQHGMRLCIFPFFRLGIAYDDGEQFSLDSSKIGKNQLSLHMLIISLEIAGNEAIAV